MIPAGDRARGASHARRTAKGLVETLRAEGIDRGGSRDSDLYPLRIPRPPRHPQIHPFENPHRNAPPEGDAPGDPGESSRSVRLRPGLAILERDAPGTWISAEEIFANFQLASVIQGGAVLSEVRVTHPFVNIVRRKDGSYNFSDLIEEFTKKRSESKEGRLLKLSLNNIRIFDGSIDFDDAPKKTHHAVRGIQVGIPFLSNFRYYVEQYVQPSFSAVVNGKRISLKGKTKPFSESLETTFDVTISDLDIRTTSNTSRCGGIT